MEKIHTNSAPAAVGPYSQAISSAGFVFCSGQIGLVPETGEFIADDIRSQTKQALQNLKAVLEAAGSDLAHVVKTTCLLSEIEFFAEFNEVYAEIFGDARPARACFAVKALPKGALVEIEAIAVVK